MKKSNINIIKIKQKTCFNSQIDKKAFIIIFKYKLFTIENNFYSVDKFILVSRIFFCLNI